tara:strand:- start:674 stop:1282 length:609 start_codon:yes stop_codon:yes gene_type:complete
MSLCRSKLKKKLFFNSVILISGSFSLINPVFSTPVELICSIDGSTYSIENRTTKTQNKSKVYPTKFAKDKSEEFENIKVFFDVNKGKGTINGSEAKILSSVIEVSKDRGPIISPVVLYASGMSYSQNNTKSVDFVLKKGDKEIYKTYLILDKGKYSSSKFTLLKTIETKNSEMKFYLNKDKKTGEIDKEISQEISYGFCKKP